MPLYRPEFGPAGFHESGLDDGAGGGNIIAPIKVGDPFCYFVDVVADADGERRGAVEFAEHAAPEPLVDAVPGLLLAEHAGSFGEQGNHDGEGHELRGVGHLGGGDDTPVGHEVRSFVKGQAHGVGRGPVFVEGEFDDGFAECGGVPVFRRDVECDGGEEFGAVDFGERRVGAEDFFGFFPILLEPEGGVLGGEFRGEEFEHVHLQANGVGVGEDGSDARMVGAAEELDHGDGIADEGFNDAGVEGFCAFPGVGVGGLCNIK